MRRIVSIGVFMGESEQRHRLKQKDLVAAIFVHFSEEYERRGADSILELEIPMPEIRHYLLARFGIDYTSDSWICTQLGKYEEENGVPLFRRRDSGGTTLLGVALDMRTYFQKQHLYVTQKIKVANGVLELVRHETPPGKNGIDILLGAGSTVSRIAEAVAAGACEGRDAGQTGLCKAWQVVSHNLGVIHTLSRAAQLSGQVELYVPGGRVDPTTNIILAESPDFWAGHPLDWVVEGTSFLKDGSLFVESAAETSLKAAILARAPGRKILIFTGHEAVATLPPGLEPFGQVADYDFVVLPRASIGSAKPSRFDRSFGELRGLFEPLALTWNFEVLKAKAPKTSRPGA